MGRAFEYRKAAKMARWGKMSKLFPKLGKAITVAAKEGGQDPEMNAKLRTAIQNAKANNMPKDNIDAAIKRAAGKDAQDIQELNYEGKGPHGVLIFIEAATENTNRTVANVKAYLSKSGGGLVPTGSLEFLFSRQAVFQFKAFDGMDLEELELDLIDAGLNKIEQDEDNVTVYGEWTSFGDLSKAFEEKGIEITESGLQRFPTSPVSFTDEEFADITKLLDKLEDDEDIQAVYTNMD
ncbi:MAG: YebC/PmpR family DNA-binding transcriptional regulator [Bacteroidia bacterium]|nr:YebC/PmpR family DNA-binding transcriptional regulator [Bacteroidia bacterium]